ncbi:MAG TPA: hypothetical protein VFP70_07770 [Burkholderiales bacterium]|nr:hypothetical protein [Burkholderiales bacterium]
MKPSNSGGWPWSAAIPGEPRRSEGPERYVLCTRTMNQPPDDLRRYRHRVPSTAFRVALVLSMLLHALMIWGWLPRQHQLLSDRAGPNAASSRLQVQLAPRAPPASMPPPTAAPAPAVQRKPPAPAKAPPRMTAPRLPSKPPAPALERPVAEVPAPARPRPAPPADDLASYIAAQRRARGEVTSYDPTVPAPPATKPVDPRDQVVTANLGLDRKPTFVDGRQAGGGIFEIRRVGYDDAEFLFFGWNPDIQRNTTQLIEVRKGGNSTIQLAVVRRMIQIIRENTDGDFLWISHRLGQELTLSARPEDTAGLEDFLTKEFFSRPSRP